MPEKDPNIINQFIMAGYFMCISAIAGAIGYLNRLSGRWGDFLWKRFALSFFTGGLNGYLVFMLCDLAGWPWQATAFLTGAAGAMGSEALLIMIDRSRSLLKSGVDNGNS